MNDKKNKNFFYTYTFCSVIYFIFFLLPTNIFAKDIVSTPNIDSDLNILGITLGDSQEEVMKKIKKHGLVGKNGGDPEIKIKKYKSMVTGEAYNAEVVVLGIIPNYNCEESFQFFLSSPTAGNKLLAIKRTIKPKNRDISFRKINDQYLEKYGEPVITRKSNIGTYKAIWRYDGHGHLMQLKNIPEGERVYDICDSPGAVTKYQRFYDSTSFSLHAYDLDDDFPSEIQMELVSPHYANKGWLLQNEEYKKLKEEKEKKKKKEAATKDIGL